MLQKILPLSAETPILMILRVRTIGSTFVWNAANWQTIDFTSDFYLYSLFVGLYKRDLIYIFV